MKNITNDITFAMRLRKFLFPYNLKMFIPEKQLKVYLGLKDLENFDLSHFNKQEDIEAPGHRFLASIFLNAIKENRKEIRIIEAIEAIEANEASLKFFFDDTEVASIPMTLKDSIYPFIGYLTSNRVIKFHKDFSLKDDSWEVQFGDKYYSSISQLQSDLSQVVQGVFSVIILGKRISFQFYRKNNEDKFILKY